MRWTRMVLISALLGPLLGCAAGGDDASSDGSAVAAVSTDQSEDGSANPSSPGSATTEAGVPLTVTSDVRFAADAPALARWSVPSFDVYAPTGRVDLPLVVVLPPHTLTKENAASVQLASALAERGMVAVVANWSQLDDPTGSFEDPAVLMEVARTGQSFAGCAVSTAVSRAHEYGADPTRLVLVGELFGANMASMVALGAADRYPGCVSTDGTWSASGFVGLNGDWLVSFPLFDPVAGAAIETLSPWSLFDRAPEIPVVLAVTEEAADLAQLCDEAAGWLASRDATGSMGEQLEAVDATTDGCIDIRELAEATAAEMLSHGLEAEVVALDNPDAATRTGAGGHVVEFGPADLALLLAAITSVTG